MANWLQLIEYTGQWVEGPYDYVPSPVELEKFGQIMSLNSGRVVATVSATEAGTFPERRDGRLSTTWEDDVRDANGRLLADAPTMLRLLARLLMVLEKSSIETLMELPELRALLGECVELLGRHVRIGYEANTSQPPPTVEALLNMLRTRGPRPQ